MVEPVVLSPAMPSMLDLERRLQIMDGRMQVLEERFMELSLVVNTHNAVCLERQKTTYHTMASIEGQIDALSNRMDRGLERLSGRMINIMIAICSGAILSTGSLLVLIITRGLKP